jgi:parvulin-like peptidyl-prolyl isomerase
MKVSSPRLIRIATAAIGLAGAGGAVSATVGGLPPDLVAKVGDDPITTTEFERSLEQQRAQATLGGQTIPVAGTTAFAELRRRTLDEIVTRRVISAEARKCGVPCVVTDARVNARIAQLVKEQYEGDQAKFEQALAERKYTLAEVREVFRVETQGPLVTEEIVRDVRFGPSDARRYYRANLARYRTPKGRQAFHILVKDRALAERISRQATAANFAALARKYSEDLGSKAQGGDLGVTKKGAYVAEFEKAVFTLKNGEISEPVKTQFGWHVIRVVIRPARTTPFDKVRARIISQQREARKQRALASWQVRTLNEYRDRTIYASIDLVPVDQVKRVVPAPTATPTP